MTAPTFISFTATVYTNTTTPKTTTSIAVQSGDVLIALGLAEHNASSDTITIANTVGSDPTWTQQQVRVPGTSNQGYTSLWSGVAPASESITVQFTEVGAGVPSFGGEVHVWRDSSGVGNSAQNNNGETSGTPTLTFTTTQADSALVMVNNDWNAQTTPPTLNESAGAAILRTDSDSGGTTYAVISATYANVGAAGSKTVGITNPTAARFQIMAIEIKGIAAETTLLGQAVL